MAQIWGYQTIQKNYDNLTLKEAVEEAKLTSKAIKNNQVYLSGLNDKERVDVLSFLGQKVIYGGDPYMTLFVTACALQNAGGNIKDIISIPPGHQSFPITFTKDLYVRETYKELYKEITQVFTNNPTELGKNRIIVTGTSGIGKSVFLLYFFIRLLAESSSNNSPIIIFQTKDYSGCYAFGGTSTMRIGSITDFSAFLYLPETWYLVDGFVEPELKIAKTIISAAENKEYKEVCKRAPWKYYMAPWQLEELVLCQSKVSSFRRVDVELVKTLYNKIGGVPLYVLQNPMMVLCRGGNCKQAEEEVYFRVESAIEQAWDVSKLLQSINKAKYSFGYSNPLLHYWPQNNHNHNRNFYVKWASMHIQEEIEKIIHQMETKNVLPYSPISFTEVKEYLEEVKKLLEDVRLN